MVALSILPKRCGNPTKVVSGIAEKAIRLASGGPFVCRG